MRPPLLCAMVLALASCGAACAAGDFAVDGARALRRVTFQVDAGPRIPGTPAHARVRDWIAGEDQGRPHEPDTYSRGARGFAARIRPRPRAAFLFDMVGDRDLGIYPEMNSVEHASSVAAIVVAAAEAEKAVHFHHEPRYHLV